MRAVGPGDNGEARILPLKQALEGPERDIIERTLRAFHGNRQATANALDINRTTLYKKMKRYGIDVESR
jgi:DNA-binding NtrC family response regulator